MPWSATDANEHITGLSARQRAVWAKVANAGLAACLRSGGAADVCEGRALRAAATAARRSPGKAIKVAPDGTLDILAVPFGGPFGDGPGKDFDGEFFSEATDLCLSWFPNERPLLYDHGLDGEIGPVPIGRVDVTTARKDAAGWWVKAQLDKSSRYWAHVAALLAEDDDVLFASSGAMSHLVKTASDGELLRWPWVELSLTPAPANLFATVEPAVARKHYQAAGLTLPEPPAHATSNADNSLKAAAQGSFEELAMRLRAALDERYSNAMSNGYGFIVATYPDSIIADIWRNNMSEYWRIPYTLDDERMPILGQAEHVDQTFKAIENADPLSALIHGKGLGLSFDDHADRVRGAVEELVERARSGSDLRLKEGRRISTARRERIASARDNLRTNGETLRGHADSLHALADELEALLSETEPPAKAAPVRPEWARLVDEFRATQAYYGLTPAEEK